MTKKEIENFGKNIAHLNYVVQRNFRDLPEIHGDLDLFVSLKDYKELDNLVDQCANPELVDIRYPGDGYYPKEIENLLLQNPRDYKGFKIPSLQAHFISLFYHNAVHKKDNPYQDKLRYLFLELYPPVKPQDSGVGYYPYDSDSY